MSNLTHLFHVGQKVRCNMDGIFWDGTVKETYPDHKNKETYTVWYII